MGRYLPLQNLSSPTTLCQPIQVGLLALLPADDTGLHCEEQADVQEGLRCSHQLQAGPKHVLLVLSILQCQPRSPKDKKVRFIEKETATAEKAERCLTFVEAALAARMEMRRWMLDQ